jgi:hypothetical protein
MGFTESWWLYGVSRIGNACAENRSISSAIDELHATKSTPEGKTAYRAGAEACIFSLAKMKNDIRFNFGDHDELDRIISSVLRGDGPGAWLCYLALEKENSHLIEQWNRLAADALDSAVANGFSLKIEASVEKAPTPMKIVSLPERELATRVTRGENGEIVGSVQLERDIN